MQTSAERAQAYSKRMLRIKQTKERAREHRKERREKENSYQRERSLRLKHKVLTCYGDGKCACVRCGFDDIRALSIDHIMGGGHKHRQGALKNAGTFYRWLLKNNCPDGYQTLCMNCQFIKRFERNEHN